MDTLQQIEARLASIENKLITAKELLTFDEVAELTGLSKSYLYKLTSARQIPHYKPNGRLIYFNRAEILEWMQRGKVATSEELETEAANYNAQRKGGRHV